jgi:hypothetical protein
MIALLSGGVLVPRKICTLHKPVIQVDLAGCGRRRERQCRYDFSSSIIILRNLRACLEPFKTAMPRVPRFWLELVVGRFGHSPYVSRRIRRTRQAFGRRALSQGASARFLTFDTLPLAAREAKRATRGRFRLCGRSRRWGCRRAVARSGRWRLLLLQWSGCRCCC